MSGTTTTTAQLIDAALQAQSDYDQAVADLALATAKKQAAAKVLSDANQALHDDLAANGPAAVYDDTQTPPVITVYQAVDPDSYSATEIRIAA
jgi:hypothetical protein